MQQPAPINGNIVSDALTHARFSRQPDLVIAYLALHASRTASGRVSLEAAKGAAINSLSSAGWASAVSALTREGLLYLEGLEARLAPLTARSAFQAAWEVFTVMTPTLRARTIAAYRAEVVKALELAGFTVSVDERVPVGAKRTVPVHALATAGGEQVAIVCCGARAVESNARKLQGASVEHAYLLTHPSNELVNVSSVEVREAEQGFDPASVDLPRNVPRDAWEQWVAYRRERKKPLTRQSVKQQLQVLTDAGTMAREVITTSINSSWLGLFPPRRQAGVSAPRGTSPLRVPRFEVGQQVDVRAPGGGTRTITVEVVSSHYVIDETGATHPIENVAERHPLTGAA